MDTYKADENKVVDVEEPEVKAEGQQGVVVDEDTDLPVAEDELEKAWNKLPKEFRDKANKTIVGEDTISVHGPDEISSMIHTLEGKLERTGNIVECQKWDSGTDVTINLDHAFSLTRHGEGQAKVGWGDTKFTLTVSYDKFLSAWKEYLDERNK